MQCDEMFVLVLNYASAISVRDKKVEQIVNVFGIKN